MAATNPNSNFVMSETLAEALEAMHLDTKMATSDEEEDAQKTTYRVTAIAMLPTYPAISKLFDGFGDARICAENIITQRFSQTEHWFDIKRDDQMAIARARKNRTDMVVGAVLIEYIKT